MRKNEIDIVLHRLPKGRSGSMSLFDIIRCAPEKILKEVCKYLHNTFVQRQRGDVLCNILPRSNFTSEMELEPKKFF